MNPSRRALLASFLTAPAAVKLGRWVKPVPWVSVPVRTWTVRKFAFAIPLPPESAKYYWPENTTPGV